MSSETREVAHNQHAHPTNRFYLMIGAALIGLTVLEVLGYLGEEKGTLGPGAAAAIILFLSALKFLLVVALYMHLKFDHKLFTGLFVFPALLATLVIGGMIMLFGPVHGTATAIHGTMTSNEGIHGAATAPAGQPAAPTTPPSR
ncbi:cytochrome C oxidase subunit IV family protein [Longimicrobium sp.]|uniref:cytochrome C oxidase subunit IV family protein n=1 Tax=Longimicrobium sp. TaxID=2029185 RepID=UPI002E2F7433|nr:cytochrome C oxidase subunit IV family protein [Longimicrobium sp.]HEX6040751.1 cytochrome C oxidase subunit IV family protein [Longimicrobium sp.]